MHILLIIQKDVRSTQRLHQWPFTNQKNNCMCQITENTVKRKYFDTISAT